MKKIILAVISGLMVSSCTVYGLTDDYKKLYPEQQRTIVKLENFNTVNPQFIYKINASQLKEELKNHPKSIVYTFKNGCSSVYCLPMSTYEKYAKKNGYQLFLVMSGYGKLHETTKQRSEVFTEPLYAIDSDYYGTRFNATFNKYFENELRGIDRKAKPEWEGNLFFFERDQLVKVSRDLP